MDPHGEFSNLHLSFNLAYASKDYNTCDRILSQLQDRVTQSRNSDQHNDLLRLEDNDNPVTGMSLENQNHVPQVVSPSLVLGFDVNDDFVLGEAEKGFPPLADLDLDFDGFHGLDEELVVNPTVAKEPSHNDVSHQQPLAIPQDDLWDIDFSLGKEGTGDARNHHAVVDDQNQGMGVLVGSQHNKVDDQNQGMGVLAGSQHNKNDVMMALTGHQDTQEETSQEDDDEEMSQEDQEDDDEEMSQEDEEDDDEEMSQDGEEDMEIHQEAQEEDDQAVNLPTKRQIKPTPKLLHSLETATSSEGSLKTSSSSSDDEDWMP